MLIFLNFVNNYHPDIKFTWEYNFETRSVVFLDLVISVDDDGYIQTDLHIKENSKHAYLLPESNHPKHISQNIPYSLAFRIKRNCSQLTKCEQRFVELSERLQERGYRKRPVEDAIEKVRSLAREDILAKVERVNNNNRVRAVFRYDRILPNISAILLKNWNTMVEDDRRLKEVFKEPPMACFTRGKNIREQLCRAMLPPARMGRQQEDGFRRCGRPQCRLCPYTNLRHGTVLKSVQISSTGVDMAIRGNITCTTPNIIYIGTCKKGDRTCPNKPQYCGETGKTAEERFVGHRNTIVQGCHENTSLPVGQHFREGGHSLSDFVFTPVERIFSRNVFVRKARERHMINTHNLISEGLNRKL